MHRIRITQRAGVVQGVEGRQPGNGPDSAGAAGLVPVEQARREGLTVACRSGRETVLAQVQAYPRPDDLAQFFDRLRALRPGLLDETDPAPLVASGLDRLSSRMSPP